jgi:hypothetical protein
MGSIPIEYGFFHKICISLQQAEFTVIVLIGHARLYWLPAAAGNDPSRPIVRCLALRDGEGKCLGDRSIVRRSDSPKVL